MVVEKSKHQKFRPWKKKLTRPELQHLKDIGVDTKKSFAKMNDWHNNHRKGVRAIEPCYNCRHIALKLGMDVYSKNVLIAVKQ